MKCRGKVFGKMWQLFLAVNLVAASLRIRGVEQITAGAGECQL